MALTDNPMSLVITSDVTIGAEVALNKILILNGTGSITDAVPYNGTWKYYLYWDWDDGYGYIEEDVTDWVLGCNSINGSVVAISLSADGGDWWGVTLTLTDTMASADELDPMYYAPISVSKMYWAGLANYEEYGLRIDSNPS